MVRSSTHPRDAHADQDQAVSARGSRWPRDDFRAAMFECPNLSPNERVVANAYAEFAKNGTETWVLTAEMTKRTGIKARDTIAKATQSLVRKGWLVLVRKGTIHQAAVYRIAVPDDCADDEHKTSLCRERRHKQEAGPLVSTSSTQALVSTSSSPLVSTSSTQSAQDQFTSSSRTRDVQRPLMGVIDGGGGRDDEHQDTERVMARVLPQLPRQLSGRYLATFRAGVSAALAAGCTAAAIEDDAVRPLNGATNPAAALARRPHNLAANPPLQPAAATGPFEGIPWCEQCDSPNTRWDVQDDGRVRPCRCRTSGWDTDRHVARAAAFEQSLLQGKAGRAGA